MTSRAVGVDSLVDRPIPGLLAEQVGRFTRDSLQAKSVRTFDPQAVLSTLRAELGQAVVAIDIGGDKLAWSCYQVRDGALWQAGEAHLYQADGGAGYLDVLEQIATLAHRQRLLVGISLAGPIDGTRLVAGPNLPDFTAELYARYDGNFARLFPAVQVANDAEAGLMAGALEAAKRHPGTQRVIYLINGSGLGGAVLRDGVIFAAEPGHVEVDARLNSFGQQKVCGVLGASHVCVEAIAASKAGLEDLWRQHRGEQRSGHDIAARYLEGDPFALALYDNSALVTAHVVTGIARAFGLPDFGGTIVVGHGGIFEVPGYRERLGAILTAGLPDSPQMLYTRDFSANTCLDGAAIAAVMGCPT
jgi:predicted NBD/HSP70 family sugar kinase